MSHNASNVFHLLDPVQTQLIAVYVSVNSNHWLSMHFHFISSPAANISNAKLEIWGKVYAIYSLLKSWYIIIHCIAQHGEEMWCKCWIDFGQDYSFQRLRVYMNIHNMCLWCSSEIDHLSRDWGTVFKTLYCASLQGAFTRLQSPIYNISAWHTTLTLWVVITCFPITLFILRGCQEGFCHWISGSFFSSFKYVAWNTE